MTGTPPQQPPSSAKHISKECMDRLGDLMEEYNGLERTEEKLLEMLNGVRREEGYLVNALNHEIFTGNKAAAVMQASAAATNYDQTEFVPQLQKITRKPPPTGDGYVQAGAKKPEQEQAQAQSQAQSQSQPPLAETLQARKISVANPTIDPTARAAKRYKRGTVRAAMDPTKASTNVPPREAPAKLREQRLLARQMLENALFAQDDDDDSSSSSSS